MRPSISRRHGSKDMTKDADPLHGPPERKFRSPALRFALTLRFFSNLLNGRRPEDPRLVYQLNSIESAWPTSSSIAFLWLSSLCASAASLRSALARRVSKCSALSRERCCPQDDWRSARDRPATARRSRE